MEAVVANSRYYPDIYPERLRKKVNICSQHDWCPADHKYKCKGLPLQIQRSGFDSRSYQIFWEVVVLERGPLSLVSTTKELLERKNSVSDLESREYGCRDLSRWPHGTLYPQKLAITSPTSGGRSVGIVRSRTQATEFSLVFVVRIPSIVFQRVKRDGMTPTAPQIVISPFASSIGDARGYLHALGTIRAFPRRCYAVSPVCVTQVVRPGYGVHTGKERARERERRRTCGTRIKPSYAAPLPHSKACYYNRHSKANKNEPPLISFPFECITTESLH
jgi:hypothetical protein